MTEDEAKTKWCPQYRVGVADDDTIDNRLTRFPVQLPRAQMCLASECMAWRWEPQTYEHHSNDVGSYVNTEPDTNRYGVRVRGKALPREGYCGLAGRP